MFSFLVSHLDAFLVERIFIKVENGGLDSARWRQDSQADVDCVTSLGIQDNDLLSLSVCCCFLRTKKTKERVTAGLICPLCASQLPSLFSSA